MAQYLLIESRDTFESGGTNAFYALAAALARKRHSVTFFLVQNGALVARANANERALRELRSAGVEILADEFSLRERGIGAERLSSEVVSADLDTVIDRLAEGHIALWN